MYWPCSWIRISKPIPVENLQPAPSSNSWNCIKMCRRIWDELPLKNNLWPKLKRNFVISCGSWKRGFLVSFQMQRRRKWWMRGEERYPLGCTTPPSSSGWCWGRTVGPSCSDEVEDILWLTSTSRKVGLMRKTCWEGSRGQIKSSPPPSGLCPCCKSDTSFEFNQSQWIWIGSTNKSTYNLYYQTCKGLLKP